MTRDETIDELAALGLSNFSEVVALVDDLGLEPRVPRWFQLYMARRELFRESPRRPSLPSPAPAKTRTLCERLAERNHHYKDFSNVYPANNDYTQLSIDWS